MNGTSAYNEPFDNCKTKLKKRAKHILESSTNDSKLRQLLKYRGFLKNEHKPVLNVENAKVISYMLENYPVQIDKDDILVGKCSTRILAKDEEEELKPSGEYFWKHHGGLRYGPGSGGTGWHRTIDFEKLLKFGINGILAHIEEKDEEIRFDNPDDSEKKYFYEVCRITLNGLLRFAERYCEELHKLHDSEHNIHRKEEIARLIDIFKWIPARPPRDFYEAIQSIWFVQFSMIFDDTSCTGRPDRYLLPYYEKGIADGKLTKEFALELIEELYLRSNEVYDRWPETIMLGGLDRQGNPVLNGLTYLFIEALETVGLVNPNVSLCYRDDMPDDLLLLCIDKISKGLTHPAIYNDNVITNGLVRAGLKIEDARCYMNSTCAEITPEGCSNVQVVAAILYPVKALEILLNNGQQMIDDSTINWRVGQDGVKRWQNPISEGGLNVDLKTLGSFDTFYDVYKQALAIIIRECVVPVVQEEYRRAHYGSCPLVSPFVNDCIERGKDSGLAEPGITIVAQWLPDSQRRWIPYLLYVKSYM